MVFYAQVVFTANLVVQFCYLGEQHVPFVPEWIRSFWIEATAIAGISSAGVPVAILPLIFSLRIPVLQKIALVIISVALSLIALGCLGHVF
jgi:hypothetical protein